MLPMESMDLFERLELSFLTTPSLKISTSLVAPDGRKIIQSNFEGFDCPAEWIATLRAMAAATKNAHSINVDSLPALPSPVTSNSNRTSANLCHRRSPSSRSHSHPRRPTLVRGDSTPLTLTLNEGSLQMGWPSVDDISSYWNHFQSPNASNDLVGNLLPSSSTTPSAVEAGQVSTPEQQSPREGMTPVSSMEQGHASSDTISAHQVNTILSENSSATPSACAMIKRMQKLEERLEAMRDGSLPGKDEVNDTVRQLYQHSSSSPQAVTSIEHFGYILGRLGNVSSAVGVIYSLLSWEIFRWEEDRLVQNEGRAQLMAAKQVNDKMAEISSRRAKTKDWASDGRRAAGMVFESIVNLSTAAQSFALLVLAGNVSLDGLLRIAHFPALREHFSVSFTQIVESRQKEWEDLSANLYLVFDYKEFLRKSVIMPEQPSSRSLYNPETSTNSLHSPSIPFDTSTHLLANGYHTRHDRHDREPQACSMETSLDHVNESNMMNISTHYC